MTKKILIFEPESSGHRNEYLSHLLNYIRNATTGIEFYFLVSRESHRFLNCEESDIQKVHFLILDQDFILNAQNAAQIINTYINRYSIDELLVMDLRLFKNSISDILSFKKIKISKKGILFNSYHRVFYKNIGDIFFLKKIYRKFLFSMHMFFNPSLKLLVLNDKFVVNQLKTKKTYRDRISFLPDPIHKQIEINIDKKPTGKFSMLIFGSLDARKNLSNIAKAFVLLPEEQQKTVKLIIKGKIRLPYKKKASETIRWLKKNTRVEIEAEDKFVSEKDKVEAFINTDLVLIVYKNFYGSSGVLGHAALYNRPVLASSYGLISDLVEEYNLGRTVFPEDPEQIEKSLIFFMENDIKVNGAKYLADRKPSDFAKVLLN